MFLKLSTILLSFSVASFAFAQDYVPGEVIVKVRMEESSGKGSSSSGASMSSFMGKAQEKQMALKSSYQGIGLLHYSLKPGDSVEQAISDLQQDPDVEYVEPNYILRKKDLQGFEQIFSMSDIEGMASGGDYLATSAGIQAQEVWPSLSASSTKPIVAVIDTGLDITHNVFTASNALWINQDEIPNNGIDDDQNGYVDDVNGWNFVHQTGMMIDDDGHGTHVSGIVLGVGQDIFTSSPAESKIQIMPLKFLDSTGAGSTSDAISAIYYAVNNGAKILNNSWGGPSYSGALHEAISYTYTRGVSFVAAAGNSANNNDFSPMYPASYNVPNVISVAATDSSDYLASFSNYGVSTVGLGSPGVFILSTIPGGGYGTSSGTSMASPFIAGVAALMLVESPQMMGYQIKNIIFDGSDEVSALATKVNTSGRVNVSTSVNVAKVATVETEQPEYSFTNQDRYLASSLAAGGCGLVSSMYGDAFKGKGGRGGPSGGNSVGAPSTLQIILVLSLLVLPILVAQALRRRNPANRRRHERFKIESDVKVSVGDKQLNGSISSISMGGVQLDTEELIENGSVIEMNIMSPDGKEQIKVNGHVVWSEDRKSYGVQFAEQTEGVKSRIRSWTQVLKPTN